MAGIAERYAREWLEQQAVAGVLTVDDVTAAPEARRYTLPDAHVGVLADPVAPDHLAPFARMIVGIATVLGDVADAYRSGGGVPYARYGADFRIGQGSINRPAFSSALVEEWLPALGPVAGRLAAGGRIADLACGHGWSALAVAEAYPDAEVWGIDNDEASITEARAAAAERGLRVRFECVDGTELATHGPFDVVMLLESLHDLARPVDVLASIRAALAGDGVLLVADEAVAADLHRTRGRHRTDDVRLEHLPLPPGGHGRAAVSRHRDGDAGEHPARAGRRGRLRPGRGARRGRRLLPPVRPCPEAPREATPPRGPGARPGSAAAPRPPRSPRGGRRTACRGSAASPASGPAATPAPPGRGTRRGSRPPR